MKKTILIKLSLILFLIIFGLIYFIEENYNVSITLISDIDDSYYNKYVKISAKIISIENFNEMNFLVLEDNLTQIDAISFERINVFKDRDYFFEGRITKYNGKLELIIEEVYS